MLKLSIQLDFYPDPRSSSNKKFVEYGKYLRWGVAVRAKIIKMAKIAQKWSK
jgi:hypothetical protein